MLRINIWKGNMEMKSKTTALILSILLGGLGVDCFYLGYTGIGILKLLTAGCFGILSLIDIINIACGNLQPADKSKYIEDVRAAAPASPQPYAAPAASYSDLEKLTRLHQNGALNDEEYYQLKAVISGGM